MPIRREYRKYYGRVWREQTRPAILERAGYRCEECEKRDHRRVWVVSRYEKRRFGVGFGAKRRANVNELYSKPHDY
jgi:hypothetical protein